jgi:prepilin-type N-terminal cleavage/methylation domain-containing protein
MACSLSDKSKKQRGFTLFELALCIAIFSVLGIGASKLMQTGVQSQISHRIHTTQQSLAMNMVDRLRQDLRFASMGSVTIANAGNTLQLITFDPNLQTEVPVTYALTGGTITRTSNGQTVNFLQGYANTAVLCNNPCFQPIPAGTAGANIKAISLNNMRVRDTSAVNSDFIASNFAEPDGTPAKSQYRIVDASFDIIANARFD